MTSVLRLLIVHNHYRGFGGEDAVVAREMGLLSEAGHEVFSYEKHNSEIDNYGWLRKGTLLGRAVWSRQCRRELGSILREYRPALVHFHNTFPLISPAAYDVAKRQQLPVVQTLHNYRLLCANALLLRDGHACEKCVSHTVGWPGVWHACYRSSRAASGVVVGMVAAHKLMGSWNRKVDVYVALTEFAKGKFVQGGLPEHKIIVKPNFGYPDPSVGEHTGRYALFVGRLSPEKGIRVLLAAWRQMAGLVPLKIVGNGPLAQDVADAARGIPAIDWLGSQPESVVLGLMREASFLIVPSISYETFSLVIAEGFATGLPAIVSNHGALTELVDHGRTGLYHRPGDPANLASKVEWAWTHPREMAEMGCSARREYELKYTAERNYQMLMEIYDTAISRARR